MTGADSKPSEADQAALVQQITADLVAVHAADEATKAAAADTPEDRARAQALADELAATLARVAALQKAAAS